MRICIVTEEQVGNSHGTGALLVRYFSEYAYDDLRSICWKTVSEKPFCKTHQAEGRPPRHEHILALLRRGRCRAAIKRLQDYSQWRSIRMNVERFRPDLLLIIACSHRSFEIAAGVMEICPKVPSLCLVWDWLFDLPPWQIWKAKRLASRVMQRADRVEVISENMIQPVEMLCGRTPKLMNFFCCDLPSAFKTEHPLLHDGVQPVLVGNIWLKHMFDLTVGMMRQVRVMEPGIKELVWYCHPQSLKRLGLTLHSLPAGIRYGGHYTGDALNQRLCESDICLIPFNGMDEPECDLARYSIPSRLSELCANGIPMFVIAGKQTAMTRYVEKKGCGIVSSPANRDRLCRDFIALASDTEKRRELGLKARRLAEAEFEITAFRQSFFARLDALCASGVGPAQ